MTDHSLLLRVPPDDINVVHDYIDDVWRQHSEVGELERLRFTTALIELASNVLQHTAAEALRAEVITTISTERIHCEIHDSAPPASVQLDTLSMPDENAESGRGIAFIQRLVDELHYERRGTTNIWSIDSSRS